jgi:uncharacterized protein YjbJ (UPF0337 family)
MSDSTKDRLEGTVDKLKGKAKETAGNVTDDAKLKQEGLVDQGKGEAKKGVAEARDRADDAFNKVTND